MRGHVARLEIIEPSLDIIDQALPAGQTQDRADALHVACAFGDEVPPRHFPGQLERVLEPLDGGIAGELGLGLSERALE